MVQTPSLRGFFPTATIPSLLPSLLPSISLFPLHPSQALSPSGLCLKETPILCARSAGLALLERSRTQQRWSDA